MERVPQWNRCNTLTFHINVTSCLHDDNLNHICKNVPGTNKALMSANYKCSTCIFTSCSHSFKHAICLLSSPLLTLKLNHRPAAFCTQRSRPPVSPWCWAGAHTLLSSAGCQRGSEPAPPAASRWRYCTSLPPCCNASRCHGGCPPRMLSVRRWKRSLIT